MKYILFLFLLSVSMGAQTNTYVDIGADANKLFSAIDNPRTENDYRGLDFDLEVGALEKKVGVYIYYGRFEQANYQNYGLGMDYYLLKNRNLDIAIGSSLSNVLRKQYFGINYDLSEWGGYLGWTARIRGVYWVLPKLGLSGRFQYQRRPDIKIHGILEGSLAITYKLTEK